MDTIKQGEQFIKEFVTFIPIGEVVQIVAKFYHSDKSTDSIVFVKNSDPRFQGANLIEQSTGTGDMVIKCYFTRDMTKTMTTGVWRVEFEITINDTKTLIYKPTIDVFAVQPTMIS